MLCFNYDTLLKKVCFVKCCSCRVCIKYCSSICSCKFCFAFLLGPTKANASWPELRPNLRPISNRAAAHLFFCRPWVHELGSSIDPTPIGPEARFPLADLSSMHTCCSRHELASYIYCTRAGSFSNRVSPVAFPAWQWLDQRTMTTIPAQLWLVTSGPWPKGSYFITSDGNTVAPMPHVRLRPFYPLQHKDLPPADSHCPTSANSFPMRVGDAKSQPVTSQTYIANLTAFKADLSTPPHELQFPKQRNGVPVASVRFQAAFCHCRPLSKQKSTPLQLWERGKPSSSHLQL